MEVVIGDKKSKFEDIGIGKVFMHEGKYFMRIKIGVIRNWEEDQNPETESQNCVCVENGRTFYFPLDSEVIGFPTAKIVI